MRLRLSMYKDRDSMPPITKEWGLKKRNITSQSMDLDDLKAPSMRGRSGSNLDWLKDPAMRGKTLKGLNGRGR